MSNIQAYQGEEPYIFISYAHKDSETVSRILEKMKENGYRFWYDDKIDPGTKWYDDIADKIKNCGFFISFVSRNYLSSEICEKELVYACQCKKKRLLVYLEDVALPSGLEMLNAGIQWHKQFDNEDKFYEQLWKTEGIADCKNQGEEIEIICPILGPTHKARIRYPNGDVYEGEVDVYGSPEGEGKYTFANGDVYEGEFQSGIRVYGKMTYTNGDVYEGEWDYCDLLDENGNEICENERCGEGICIYANGDSYSGTWYGGKWHGNGEYMSESRGLYYAGEWVNGKMKGMGKIIHPDKTVEDGICEIECP